MTSCIVLSHFGVVYTEIRQTGRFRTVPGRAPRIPAALEKPNKSGVSSLFQLIAKFFVDFPGVHVVYNIIMYENANNKMQDLYDNVHFRQSIWEKESKWTDGSKKAEKQSTSPSPAC